MSLLGRCLLGAWLVLKFPFVVVVVSPAVPPFMVVAPSVVVMLLSRVKLFEDFEPFFLLHITIMNELWVVKRHPGQRLAKVVQPVHLVHELSRHFVSEVLVVPYYPNACSRRNSDRFCNPWKNVTVYYHSPHVFCFLFWTLPALLLFLHNRCRPLVPKNIVIFILRAFFAASWLRLLVLNAEIWVSKIVILILFNFLNEAHVNEIFHLFFLVFCPFVRLVGINRLLWFRLVVLTIFWVGILFLQFLLVFLTVVIF